jgi:hypothetical protein
MIHRDKSIWHKKVELEQTREHDILYSYFPFYFTTPVLFSYNVNPFRQVINIFIEKWNSFLKNERV